MKNLYKIFALTLILFAMNMNAQDEKNAVSAKIESNFVEGMMSLKGTASNKSNSYKELNYLFVSIKRGGTGNLSNNKQSGKFTLKPEETKTLSQMTVNIQKNDALKVFLYIKDDQTDQLVSKDSLELNSKSFNEKISNVHEDEIFELKGLTIDQTKTKSGKDFYDLFYLEYSKLPEKISNAITIDELPSSGQQGSQISIGLDDKMLYSFVANPNEDYLSEQANISIRIIMDYYSRSRLIKNEFRY